VGAGVLRFLVQIYSGAAGGAHAVYFSFMSLYL